MVYNYKNSSTYRCIYPKPPPASTVTNCSDGGVLGLVPGIIGSIQALEAIKIILPSTEPTYVDKMLLFNALTCSFKTIKMRSRNKNCPVGGDNPSIFEPVDYLQFCGALAADDKEKPLELLTKSERLTIEEMKNSENSLIVDVREPVELTITSPFQNYKNFKNISFKLLENAKKHDLVRQNIGDFEDIVCVCRRGNNSQKAVRLLQQMFPGRNVKDLEGGIYKWAEKVDDTIPLY